MNNSASQTNTGRSRGKRVARACDPCRRKRLKCTPNQRPCLNCQLYNAECTSHDHGRRPYERLTRSSRPTERPIQPDNSIFTPPTEGSGLSLASDFVRDDDSSNNNATNHKTPPLLTSWPREQELSEIPPPSGEFDSVLRQLGIGFSASFWEPERMIPDHLPAVDYSQPVGLGNEFGVDQMLPVPAISSSHLSGYSPAFSPTSIQRDHLDRGKVSSIGSLAGAGGEDGARLQTSVPGMFVRKNETDANYLGFNSVGATLAVCLKDALAFQQLPLAASSLRFLIEAGPYVDEVGLSSTIDFSLIELPSQEMATKAVDGFLSSLNVLYPIVERHSYEEKVRSFYSGDRSHLKALDYSLFFLILSIGGLVCAANNPDQPQGMMELSVSAYHQAWTMVQDCIASPTEASLQVLLLYVFYHHYHGKAGIAWVFCGLAIRVAQALGLHRKSPAEMELPDNRHYLRARLWWIVFSLDANLSLSQGRPPGVAHATYEDTPVYPPQPDGDTDSNDPHPSLSHIYTWMRSLSQIQNRLCNFMHMNSTSTARLDALLWIKKELIAWRDTVPSECRPGDPIIVSPERYTNIMLLHLEYFNLSRALHWTIVKLEPMFSGGSGVLDQHIRASEALCVEAVRSFIKTLNDGISETSPHKLFVTSFQTINYMAAVAVLYRSISKSPCSLSARADFEHLRAGKIHLERDTPNGVSRPELKRLFNDMAASARDLVWKHSEPGSGNN